MAFNEELEKPSFSLAITTKYRQKSDFVIFYDPEIINYTSSNIHKKPDIINLIFKSILYTIFFLNQNYKV